MSAAIGMDKHQGGADFPTEIPALREALIDQRKYTLALYADLPQAWWVPSQVPYMRTINPPLWELAHIAWFAEFFCLRWRSDDLQGLNTPSILADADRLFNSQTVAHQVRWALDYPDRRDCLGYMQDTLAAVIDALEDSDPGHRHAFQLAVAHEDMHAEALAMSLRTLDLSMPSIVPIQRTLSSGTADIAFTGGSFVPGASGRSFAFDNELPARTVELPPFTIAGEVLGAAEFDSFAGSPAYLDDRLWTTAGLAWRSAQANRVGQKHGFPATHVSCFEAEAWCRWAGRRLPTEYEWEFAATRSPEFASSTGKVWEWTASPFAPYEGFVPGPYADYSLPWFHTHRVLKGGAFATHARLKYPQYRNFYEPGRNDVFCGFRTCALA